MILKQLFDFFVSLFLLVLFLPIVTILAIIILGKLGRPILFKQLRPGLYGHPFIMYKFRTMLNKCDCKGRLLSDGERLTRFGKFLRKYSLDELPELFNIIKGDMSLVGPRPLLLEYLPLYSKQQRRRHKVKPGITGWAQVNGRNNISWNKKLRFDVWYVNNQSFGLDLKILCITFKRLFSQDGINKVGHATVDKFNGFN